MALAERAFPHPDDGPNAVAERQNAFALLKAELSAKARPAPMEGLLATDIPEIDQLLEGGFPLGIVATLEGGTGRWSLAAGLLARMTRRSLVAILNDGMLYPPSLVEAGVRLDRVLVVPARDALKIARAADLLLRSRICTLVLMPAVELRAPVWTRLATLAHRTGVVLLVMAAHAGAALTAASELRLHCVLERMLVRGKCGLWGSFTGFELCVDVRKHKRLPPGRQTRVRIGDREAPDAALR